MKLVMLRDGYDHMLSVNAEAVRLVAELQGAEEPRTQIIFDSQHTVIVKGTLTQTLSILNA